MNLRTVLPFLFFALVACPSDDGDDDDDDDTGGEGEGEGEQCEARTCDRAGEQCCPIDETRSVCTNLNTTITSCGECGRACDFEVASLCVSGECLCGESPPCEGGPTSTCCAGQPASCVDLQTTDEHCGMCNNACNAPAVEDQSDHCFDGQCVCGDTGGPCEGTLSSTCCPDEGGTSSCHDIVNEPENCGDCGIACDPTQANICHVAQCVCGIPKDIVVPPAPCEGTRNDTCCAPDDPEDADLAVCVDLDQNFLHCGSCDNPCDEGEVCEAGNCVAE